MNFINFIELSCKMYVLKYLISGTFTIFLLNFVVCYFDSSNFISGNTVKGEYILS